MGIKKTVGIILFWIGSVIGAILAGIALGRPDNSKKGGSSGDQGAGARVTEGLGNSQSAVENSQVAINTSADAVGRGLELAKTIGGELDHLLEQGSGTDPTGEIIKPDSSR